MPAQLRILREKFRDEDGEPLFADLTSGDSTYISESYNTTLDLAILRKMGAKYMSSSGFLQRLGQDLDEGRPESDSRMKSTPLDYHWHTQVADILIDIARDEKSKKSIQKTCIIPLDGGKWVRPLGASIFFPTSGGIDIPEKLPLSLVGREALENLSRKTLFSELGVVECSPARIFPLIEQRYIKGGTLGTKLLIQDMKFLFCHHSEMPKDKYSVYISATSGEGYMYSCIASEDWIYCPKSNHRYATFNLLGGVVPAELKNKIRYPRSGYYDALEACGIRNKLTGIEWLRSLGIKETPQLRGKPVRKRISCPDMSAELMYIAENLPQHLLGVLEANWMQYNKSEEWDTFFKETKVPVLDSSEVMHLKTTYLPLPKLKAIASSLGLEKSFGFLQELDGITNIEGIKWKFLERFGVGVDEGVSFWLALLRLARRIETPHPQDVFKIYSRLQTYVEPADIKKVK